MRMVGVSPTVSMTLSKSRPRPAVDRIEDRIGMGDLPTSPPKLIIRRISAPVKRTRRSVVWHGRNRPYGKTELPLRAGFCPSGRAGLRPLAVPLTPFAVATRDDCLALL